MDEVRRPSLPRRGRPALPDERIIAGARTALSRDPQASMIQVARTAGVGMSALYARFGNREALLRYFADEGNERYAEALADARADLDSGQPAVLVLDTFMARVVTADIHQLLTAVSGTFERSPEDLRRSRQLRRRGLDLVAACHREQALRPGVTWRDLMKIQEMIAAVTGSSARRTRDLRLRMLDVALVGLRGGDPMRGGPPRADDLAENRRAGR